MFHGFDFDGIMLRIGSMNMTLHGIEDTVIRYKGSLSQERSRLGPVFAGAGHPAVWRITRL